MRGKVARYASALVLVLLASAANAKSEPDIRVPGTPAAKVANKLTSKDVEKMSLDELRQVQAEIGTLAMQLHSTDGEASNPATEIPAIRALAKYEVYEAIFFVQYRAWIEVQKAESAMSLDIIEACLDTLNSILVAKPSRLMDDMDRLYEVAGKAFTTLEGKQLHQYIGQVSSRALSRRASAYSIDDLIEQAANTPRQLSRDLRDMQEFLSKRILGQPEVVDALMALEWNNQLFKGARMAPDVIYLMGLPGTGKDTAAEAFTDALWRQEGAYETHMFRLTLKDKPELWQALGSATGYIGSDSFPPFLEFLVNHSGGRYLLKQAQAPGQKPSFSIVQNPEWKGVPIEGYSTPDKAVVFANEFHNWSKDNKDILMKQALEKGYFKVNNPNGGLSEIYVPVRFVIASNEGIPLITAREANGERFGKPLEYDQIEKKWEAVHNDKEALKGEILSRNGDKNSKPLNGTDTYGTSEELLNRIPSRFILLMRPLSPEALKSVVDALMNSVSKQLAGESGFFKSVTLDWGQSLTDFVQSYDYIAENNARPIKGNLQSLIIETLTAAMRDGDLPVGFTKPNAKMHLNITTNPDKTANLVISYEDENGHHEVTKLIGVTEKDRPAPPLTPERIAHLKSLAERLKQRVFGIDVIADRLADRVLAIENQRTADSAESRKVSVLVALGLSSTGKTELAKALSYEMTGEEGNLVTFDFSQIQTMHDFQTRILGVRNGQSSVASDFMKAYDRAGGKMIVAFDELANVKDQQLLTALYDFFREPIISTFSDGKPRKMGAVMVLVTGNAGQELYKNVPREAPMAQQMAAWEEISKRTAMDPELQRQILERYFPEPLVNRFGKNNIFFFPPHTYRTLKQLVQLKLSKQIKRLADTTSKHGWNVVVPSLEDYNQLVETIVNEGFSLRYQGASVDSYVTEDFSEAIESILLKEGIASGATVVVKMISKTANNDDEKRGSVHLRLYVDGRAPINFALSRAFEPTPVAPNLEKQMITGYHEAGHSLIGQAMFPEINKPGLISIIPGVTQIGEDWIMYLGIARHEVVGSDHIDRLYIAKQIAILAAGETAERLVTRGEQHTAGKSNDMERATTLAQNAILRYGLSDAWGVEGIPTGVDTKDYLNSLSNEKRNLLDRETKKLLKEGRDLAEQYLTSNFDILVSLGNLLIESGIRSKEEMQQFYLDTPIIHYGEQTAKPGVIATLKGKWQSWVSPTAGKKISNNFKPKRLRDDIQLASHVADIDEIVENRKLEQYASVAPPESAPIGTNQAYEASIVGPQTCAQLLGGL